MLEIDENIHPCKGCLDYNPLDSKRGCQSNGGCGRKQTNADRVRAMTDEELAEWIIKHDCHTNLYGYDPKDAILDWLKQEG